MTIKLNGSTAGSVALDAPASTTGNADINFKLPVADGTAGQVIKTDGSGNLSFGGSGITVAQQFRLAADQAGSASTGTVLTNWEESDTDYQRVGSSAWSQSSGVFSCSATGIYLCQWTFVVNGISSSGDAYDPNIQISTDSGNNYATRSRSWGHVDSSVVGRDSPQNQFIFDVANTSTFRLVYRQSQDNACNSITTIAGSTSENLTNILFIRLGDT